MKTHAFAILAAGLLLPAARASAQPAAPNGSFVFFGDVEGRFESGRLNVTAREGGTFAIAATEKRRPAVEWEGVGTLDGRVLTIRRGSNGIAPTLTGDGNGLIEYVAQFDAGFEAATIRAYRIGAAGARTEIGTATLGEKLPLWQKLPGELLGLARREVDKAIHKEIDLSKEFSIFEYAHLGVRVGADLLQDSERTDFMKESDRQFRAAGKGEPIWIRSLVEGGPRIAYGVSVPIDAAGTIRIDAGFQLGAQIRYTCDDQHLRPASVTDARGALKLIEEVPARAFALPLTADKAEALAIGTRRTLEGYGALAITGGVSFGYRLEELGALKDRAEVGVRAGLSVHWNIRGDLKVDVERQTDKLIRVRWTKGSVRNLGAGVGAFLGLSVDPALIAKVPGPADKVVSAVVKEGEKYTTVEFNASVDWLKQKELVIDMTFDLTDPKAREAYEKAVVGNLLAVQAMADSNNPGGLKAFRITSTLTDALSTSASFKAFRVLNASTARNTTDIHVDVSSLDGTTSTTDTFDYTRRSTGLFGGERSLSAEAVGREVVRVNAPVERGSRVTFHFAGRDDTTWKGELMESLALGSLLVGNDRIAAETARMNAFEPGFLRHLGVTSMTLDLTLGDRAIDRILGASYDQLLSTYGRAHWEKSYQWNATRVAFLKNLSLASGSSHDSGGETQEERENKEEAWALKDAESVLKLIAQARRTGASRADRVEAFRSIAKRDGFKLRAVVALALVAGPEDALVQWSLKAKDWLSVEGSAGTGAAPLPTHP